MWYSMLGKVISNENLPRTAETATQQFQIMLEDMPSLKSKLTETKKGTIASMIAHLPAAGAQALMSHMETRLWQRCALNSEIVAAKELRKDFCPSSCVGHWTKLLRNTPEIVESIIMLVEASWLQQLSCAEDRAKARDIMAARPKPIDMERFQVCAALWHNWLLPELRARNVKLVELFEPRFQKLRMVDDLARVSPGRSSLEMGSKLSLHILPAIQQEIHLLEADDTVKCAGGADVAKISEGFRAECRMLLQRMSDVQQEFATFVDHSIGVAQRDQLLIHQRIEENKQAGKIATTQFLHTWSRVQHLPDPVAAQDLIMQFRRDVLQAKHSDGSLMYDAQEHQVPMVLVFEIGNVPLENEKGLPDLSGNVDTWRSLVDVIKVECVTFPDVTIGFVVHSCSSMKTSSKYIYNTSFLAKLVDGKINVDKEVSIRFSKANNRLKNSQGLRPWPDTGHARETTRTSSHSLCKI